VTPNEIHIKFIPHHQQDYSTAGDYWGYEDKWHVRISKTEDPKHQALVLIHEIVEMFLTEANGVSWEEIDKFDKTGGGKDHPDPGTLKSAPYHNEHMLATQIEKRVAKMLGVDWKEYNQSLDSLE